MIYPSLFSLLSTSREIARVRNRVSEMPSRAARTRARWCNAAAAKKWNGFTACLIRAFGLGLEPDISYFTSEKEHTTFVVLQQESFSIS
jgi:hypothetical protein